MNKFTKEQLEEIIKFKDTYIYVILEQVFKEWYEDEKSKSFNETLIGVDTVNLAHQMGFRKGRKSLMDEVLNLPDVCRKVLTELGKKSTT